MKVIQRALTEGGKVSEEQAERWLNEALVLLDRVGATQSGNGNSKAERLLRRAAAAGNADAMVELANIYTAPRRKRSLGEGIDLYRRAYALGASNSAYNLGVTYLFMGRHSLALRWLKTALSEGERSAELPIAEMELFGLGTRRNVRSALSRLRRVASSRRDVSGFERECAMLMLAGVFLRGIVVPMDRKIAQEWLNRAARAGSSAAKGLLLDLE